MPSLRQFMTDTFPPDPTTEDGQRELENAWRAWAARNNLLVEKLVN